MQSGRSTVVRLRGAPSPPPPPTTTARAKPVAGAGAGSVGRRATHARDQEMLSVYGLVSKGAGTVAADGAESAARARAGEGITNSVMDQDKERKVRAALC